MSQQRPHGKQPDQASGDSFPASDPPSTTPVAGPGRAAAAREDGNDKRPKGTPTDERHATETAHARIEGESPSGGGA